MQELKFKTTLKCGGCESNVKPGLDTISEIESWEVDLASADKILTVTATEDVEAQVKAAFEAKGFVAERI